MKRNIIYIVFSLVLAIMTSSCMGVSSGDVLPGGGEIDGISEGLPSGGVRLTDVGNSEESEELMKSYVNPEFEVKGLYPGSWDLKEEGTERADFTSQKGESVTATFVWLEEGDTFENFLTDARGDISDLNEIVQTPFDRTLCSEADTTEDGMLIVECYHYYEFEKGKFVATVGGFMLPESMGLEAEPYGMKAINEMKDASIAMAKELLDRDLPKACIGLDCAGKKVDTLAYEVAPVSIEVPQAVEPIPVEVHQFKPVIKKVVPIIVN